MYEPAMKLQSALIHTLLLTTLSCVVNAAETFLSVKDVRQAVYEEQKFYGGCYKLLNANGPVGSQAPSRQSVKAPLIRVTDINTVLTDDRAVLVVAGLAQVYLAHLQANPSAQAHVKMVLVLPDERPASDSPASTFPGGAEFAPYASTGQAYAWNPFGTGTELGFLPFPVFKLGGSMVDDVAWRADYNMRNDYKGAAHWMEAELTMEATQPNSTACLLQGTCQPLGGFSVWAAIPPLPVNETSGAPTRSGKPVTLVTAQLDAWGLFRDDVQAAGRLSGLVALLGAMDILRAANVSDTYTQQLVFAAIAGDAWGYMGSRRFAWDMARGSNWTAGLDWADVDQVIELGPIGRAYDQAANASKLFTHSQPSGSTWGDASELRGLLSSAAAVTREGAVTVTAASPTNPGLPPSSLFSFLRVKPSISGLYLAEFDSQYINPYWDSAYDNASFVQVESLSYTAVTLARALHALALNTSDVAAAAATLPVDMLRVTSVVVSLAQCLLMDDPGMSCATATNLLNPDFQVTDQVTSYAVKHYMGVLAYIHPDPSEPFYKKTQYRFLWNLMGWMAAQGTEGAPCAFSENQCAAGHECIGWKGSNKKNKAGMGRCWRTTVRYAPSLSTALDFEPYAYGPARFYFSNASASWDASLGWPADPLWTEANWPSSTPFLRVSLREAPRTERAVLAAGLVATAATAAAAWVARTAFERHLKQP